MDIKIGEKQIPDLSYLKFMPLADVFYQLTPGQYTQHAVENNEGHIADSGALAINTGAFTGRSPQDRFIVADEITGSSVFWGDINKPFREENFHVLQQRMLEYLENKTIYIQDGKLGARPELAIGVRVISTKAYQGLFAYNMFIRENDVQKQPEWIIISVPDFNADPLIDGTRQKNFSIISFSRRTILIGGTGYTGEIKKGMFSVLNFLYPENGILSMHCSANISPDNETSIFFGLSGTGKTTLSADSGRQLVGDDEHGWDDKGVFNFEGGCYAKCINLSAEKEPEIFSAVKAGALLENITFFKGSNTVNFDDMGITENTRVSYPINYIANAVEPSIAPKPKHIFFLTADAFGVLPPISKLNPEQAMYYFLLGYTAKVAGTEMGITKPVAAFSACFGKAFLPLHPMRYACLLKNKIENEHTHVWLVNTGWSGGSYGTGSRIKLSFTRAMVRAAQNGSLQNADYIEHPIFKLMMPERCADVPDEILNPEMTWQNKELYGEKANELLMLFEQHYQPFKEEVMPCDIL